MIVILGATCTGKDTLARVLCEKYGYQKILTCTTRPKRENEDGTEYRFITKDAFKAGIENDMFFEYTSYNVASGETWYYGTLKADINEIGIIILNPDGYKVFKKYYPDALYVRLYAPLSVIRRRLYQRGDNIREAERRIKADINDFMLIETSDECNLSFNTNNYSSAEMASIIDRTYKEKIGFYG